MVSRLSFIPNQINYTRNMYVLNMSRWAMSWYKTLLDVLNDVNCGANA